MRTLLYAVTLAALPILTIADQRPEVPRTSRGAVAANISQERLDRIRRSLVAQIAVYDQAEAAPRAPSVEEAAALAVSAPEAPVGVVLPGGGVGLQTTAAQLSWAVATRDEAGTLRVTHDGGAGLAQTGGRHAR